MIAYDNQDSAFASRLWWMLRAIGHDKVQVLDGGLGSWTGPISTTKHPPAPLDNQLEPKAYAELVEVNAVLENIASQRKTILDARTPDRFHGINETIDPVAGAHSRRVEPVL